jgi:branched-chain amino acid aminotransferase
MEAPLLKYPFSEVRSLWLDGGLIPFAEAKIHILAHTLHYGSGVFEGIRSYKTPAGTAIFRLREHVERLFDSAKALRIELPYTVDELCGAVVETVRDNELGDSYIRPIVFRGFGSLFVNPRLSPLSVAIAAWPTRPGRYLGEGTEETGIEACVSSWRRLSPGSLPPLAKATANYLNSQLIKMEAEENGYNEGIGLDEHGDVCEGSAENVFLVQDGVLLTPSLAGAILAGITRDAVLTLARDLGIGSREEGVPRGLLYTCDELFLTGTAVEIAAIRAVDRIPVGAGRPGEITRKLQAELLGIARGEQPDRHGWLTPV